MPASSCAFDVARHWQPVASSLDTWARQNGEFADCAASVLAEVESIANEVGSRARELDQLQRQLELREQELNQQRTDYGKLTSQFDQQAARLAETTEELAELRQEIAQREPTGNLAADSAQAAFAQARELWQRDRSDVLERLSALTLMQQTGSSDNEAVQAFCHELTEIRQLIENTQAQSRDAVQERLTAIGQQVAALAEASKSSPAQGRLDELCQSLSEVQKQLTSLQASPAAGSSPDQDLLLKRLDSLAAATPAVDHSPLLATILEQLQQTRQTLDDVRKQAGAQSKAQEASIAELRTELETSRAALQEGHAASGSEAFLKDLRTEVESLRKTTEDARQQAQRQETERALVEAELDRVRTQAAQWRRELDEQTAHYHEEERQWHEELQDLRHLIGHAAAAAAGPGQVTAEHTAAGAKAPDSADPVASSLLAQFTKLQKDSARRRTRS